MIRSGLSLHQLEQLIWTEAYTYSVEHRVFDTMSVFFFESTTFEFWNWTEDFVAIFSLNGLIGSLSAFI